MCRLETTDISAMEYLILAPVWYGAPKRLHQPHIADIALFVCAGASIADIERELRAPAPAQPAPAQQKRAEPAHKAEPAPQPRAPPPPPAQPVVGQSIGMKSRNPLDLINPTTGAPLQAREPASNTALSQLARAVRTNELVVWHRVSAGAGA